MEEARLICRLHDISGLFLANEVKGKVVIDWEGTAKQMKRNIDLLIKEIKEG